MRPLSFGPQRLSNSDARPAPFGSSGSAWILAILIISTGLSVGCAPYQTTTPNWFGDRIFCSWRDTVWAQRAFHFQYPNCSCAHPSHFRRGFIAGYVSICNGGDGYVPATPPRNYWGYSFQSAEGQELVDAWFAGYPQGVEAALSDGAGAYRDVQVSRMIDDALAQSQPAAANLPPANTVPAGPVPVSTTGPVEQPPLVQTASPSMPANPDVETRSTENAMPLPARIPGW